jgi:hypothetical protein
MLQGILPDTKAVDPEIALKTADKIWEVWTDTKIRGWGRPVLAINSARIGNPERAIYHLTAYDYWIFDDAGGFFWESLCYAPKLTTLILSRLCCPWRRR